MFPLYASLAVRTYHLLSSHLLLSALCCVWHPFVPIDLTALWVFSYCPWNSLLNLRILVFVMWCYIIRQVVPDVSNERTGFIVKGLVDLTLETQCHITEDQNPQLHHCENLKTSIVEFLLMVFPCMWLKVSHAHVGSAITDSWHVGAGTLEKSNHL